MNGRKYLQPTLFDASEFEGPVSHTPQRARTMSAREEYGDARRHGGMGLNPLHSPAAGQINYSGPVEDEPERGKFIPTNKIVSGQPQVSNTAVDMLVNKSTGLDTPDIVVREGTGEHTGTYALRDGNHRVMAALRRGQALIPAQVYKARGGGE